MQHLAIYDMDKTITAAPTWTRFLVKAARRHAPWRLGLLPVVGLAGGAYLLKRLDRAALKQVSHRLLLGHSLGAADLERVADGFAAHEAEHGVLHGARARIAEDRAAGYRLVMATASHGFYAAGIARRLGFDDVIATQAQRNASGHILSLLEGENCYGPVKLRMVEDWLAGQGIDRDGCHVRAYSDHVSDAPLLAWADEPFAVNAHAPLRTLAAAKGWPLLDWR
ncbi:HAD family hydrolase [Sphingomonas xinjiangensis]|uniref:HAD superfamily hydrolase (TIGR01490 family) n=1 Tax=Sphingomonas xinjiangensis TaxID=643568 RepID=A0A840YJT9_9SPHN|nr:HAD-IB family hydrolase [Sphingomonas xinjiangensis]MBB5711308.1 HAD superfamily hydrolase (TIGR01490 family) [Sphingomonas xinjiangensis]